MSLLDIFRRKKKPEKIEKEPEKKSEKDEIRFRPQKKKAPVKAVKTSRKTANLAWSVLMEPHVTEKATDLEKGNKYVFKIFKKANKIQVKKAVEDLYGVDVINVKIINIPRKKRRVRRKTEGFKKGYKKAIVRIAEGQKIEIMPR